MLPIEEWPWFAVPSTVATRGAASAGTTCRPMRSTRCATALRAEGPLTTAELGGAKRSGEWWDWSEAKVAVEWLLDIGEVVCVRRVGWRRVYDLAERAVPEEHRGLDAGLGRRRRRPRPDDDACLSRAAAALGPGLRGGHGRRRRRRPPPRQHHRAAGPARAPARRASSPTVRSRGSWCRGGRARRTPTQGPWPPSRRVSVAAAPRCSRRSTPSSGTASARPGCSASTTSWSSTCRSSSGSTATSRCRCCTAAGSWPASTPSARGARSPRGR